MTPRENMASATTIATIENAYRLAHRIAEATDQDMQVKATGNSARPFIAEPANDDIDGVVLRIVSG